MPDPTDLRTICSALDHFSLPAALGNLKDDALVFWNQAFQKRAGFSEIELAQARLNSLILLDESYSGLVVPAHDPENEVRFVERRRLKNRPGSQNCCGNSLIISAVLLKSLRYKPNPFLSVKPRAWTACWNPERLTELGECKPLGACTLNLKLSSSVLVRDLVFSNFNSVALSLDYTSMALSESPFLIRCESAGESKIAWPDVDFRYFVDYWRLIRGG
jgi:hypothetical protein